MCVLYHFDMATCEICLELSTTGYQVTHFAVHQTVQTASFSQY